MMKQRDYKKELLIKEYELLMVLISTNKAEESKIRGWCIALLLVVFGSSIKLEVNNIVSLFLSMLVIILFFLLSLGQSYFLKKTRDRIFYVQDMLNNLYRLSEEEINKIETPKIIIKSTTKEAILITLGGFRYKNMVAFYLTLSVMIVLSYIYVLPKFA